MSLVELEIAIMVDVVSKESSVHATQEAGGNGVGRGNGTSGFA